MIQNLVKNWRTTSLGLTTIAGAIVNLAFAVKNQTDSQAAWMMCITTVLGGLGLIFAGDSAASKDSHDQSVAAINDLQFKVAATATAVKTGSTDIIDRASIPTLVDSDLKPVIPPVNKH